MEQSSQLKDVTTRRAQRDQEVAARRSRTPQEREHVRSTVLAQALQMASRHGVDPSKIRPATDEEMDASARAADQEIRRRQVEIRLRTIPPMYREIEPDFTIDEHRQAARWVQGYRAGARRNLLLLGNPGTGKTHVAAAVLRALLVHDYVPAVFITAKSLMDALRPSSSTGDVDMQLFKLAPVLLLDDLGAERVSEFVIEQLTDLANDRVQHRRPTIITSNLAPKAIKATYQDPRLIERLFSNCDVIRMTGRTRRVMAPGFGDDD